MLSLGILGLTKAIKTFDISKNIKFSTYATTCIDNEILIFIKKLEKINSIKSMEEQVYRDHENEYIKFEDTISDDYDIIEELIEKENNQTIEEIINILPNKEKELIILYFGFNNNKQHKQHELAKIFNISI